MDGVPRLERAAVPPAGRKAPWPGDRVGGSANLVVPAGAVGLVDEGIGFRLVAGGFS